LILPAAAPSATPGTGSSDSGVGGVYRTGTTGS
jgi:hypothetical protein